MKSLIFSGESVRAILSGQKTMTRRVVNKMAEPFSHIERFRGEGGGWIAGNNTGYIFRCPFGDVGDCLWVREAFYVDVPDELPEAIDCTYYRADGECCQQIPECQCADVGKVRWRSPIHMPRWASRITLEITSLKVERLNDISQTDAKAEGVEPQPQSFNDTDGSTLDDYRGGFQFLWDEINGKKHSWESNPWVWVIEFRKV